MKRDYVERRICEDQAAVLRRIFSMAAAGHGLDAIARTLTAERVPPLRTPGRGWAPSAIRSMLRNEL